MTDEIKKVVAKDDKEEMDIGNDETGRKNENKSEELSNAMSDLKSKFEQKGLDSDYWSKQFKKKLGITKSSQLVHLTPKDLGKVLQPDSSDLRQVYNWEKVALHSLIDHNKNRGKTNNKITKNTDYNARNELVNEMVKEIKGEDIAKKLLVSRRSSINSEEKECIPKKRRKVDLQQAISPFTSDGSSKTVCRPELSAIGIITHASGGLALMGIYINPNRERFTSRKKQVIEVNGDIKLQGPLEKQREEYSDFSSRKKKDSFDRTLDTTIYNAKLDSSIGIKYFGSKIQGSYLKMNDSERRETENSEEIFQSREKSSFVPLSSCELKVGNIKLVYEALEELRTIENKTKQTNQCSSIMSLCTRFFEKYGSHVGIGKLHFGGIYKWIATYTSQSTTEKISTKDIVEDALDGFISIGVGGLGCGVGASISGKYLASNSSISQKYDESELSKITLKIEPDGGPPDELDFNKWKHGLVAQNATWSLIHRDDFCGLWDVLKNHESDFSDIKTLSCVLESAWCMGCFTNSVKDRDRSNYSNLLILLCQTIEKLNGIFDAQGYFRELVQNDDSVQEFFECIATSTESHELIHSHEMRQNFFILLDSLKNVYFPKRLGLQTCIAKQIENIEDYPCILPLDEMNDANCFIKYLKNKFVPLIRTYVEKQQNRLPDDKYFTKEFTRLCQQICDHFRDSGRFKQFAILLSLMQTKLQFEDKKGFSTLVTKSDIEKFINEAGECLNSFQQSTYSTDHEEQAHLIDFIVSNITIRQDMHDPDDIFQNCYKVLEPCIDDVIKNIINKQLKNCPCDWTQLRSDLQPFKIGVEMQMQIFSLPDMNNASKERTEDTVALNYPQIAEWSDELRNLIEDLEMSKYFPNQLELVHVISVDSKEIKNDIASLPWLMLRMILMQNSAVYAGLEKHMADCQILSSKATESEYHNTNTVDIQDEENQIDYRFLNALGDNKTMEYVQINPLDLIVAIFMCSSHHLKQEVAAKMYACRLAIPVIFHQKPPVLALEILQLITLSTQGESIEALDCPCNVLSFIRIGRPKFSKSKFINQFIFDEVHHTFFNHDLPLGTTKRKVSNGLVETTFIKSPVEAKSGTQNNILVFNLRGNAIDYPEQMKLLSSLSLRIVILTTFEELECKQSLDCLQQLHKNNSKLTIMLDEQSRTKKEIENLTTKTSMCPEKPNLILAMEGPERRPLTIIRELKSAVNDVLMTLPTQSITQLVAQANIDGFVNQNYIHVSEKVEAEKLISHISDDIASVIPLQLEPLYAFSSNLKKLYKPAEYKTQTQRAKIRQDMVRARRRQLELILHPFVISFLQQMKNRLTSDTHLIILVGWIKSLIVKNISGVKSFVFQNTLLTKDLKNSKLEFEHLIREIGQLYETIVEHENLVDSSTLQLAQIIPRISAKLLLMGLPFEVMNGDIIHVPIKWVKAVLMEVGRIVDRKKCIILSVVGIQSSGKSTLLNTMFGLRLPVGHGRVTQGAVMQFIPVNDEKLPFDFILVLDTEGLRAPERGDQHVLHDNEFASFVIGLADINIINIEGENQTEMNDVLQMVVRSLLRLQLVKEKLSLRQSCVFVHQRMHVESSMNAVESLSQTFVSNLNRKTEEVAEELAITGITTFSQVINFDKKNIWYLPALFAGSPPMERINHNYSQKVAEIRNTLLYEIAFTASTRDNLSNISMLGTGYFTLQDTVLRIQDMWNGILMADFSYDFRNALEVKAFTTIENNYHKIEWKLEKYVSEFVQEQKCTIIKCSDDIETDDCIKNIAAKIPEKLQLKCSSLQDEFESFVDKHSLKTVLMKWKQIFVIKMHDFLKTQIDKCEKEFLSLKEEIIESKKYDRIIKECEGQVNFLATKLADAVKDSKYDADVLENKFTSSWVLWEANSPAIPAKTLPCMSENIKRLVVSRYSTDTMFLKEVHDITDESCLEVSKLQGRITYKDICDDKHIYRPKSVAGYIRVEKKDVCIRQAIDFTDKLFGMIENYCRDLQFQDSGYKDFYMKSILNIIDEQIEKHNKHQDNDYKFNILLPYQALILTHVVRFCIKLFIDLERSYEQRHSPRAKLKSYKDAAWNLFQDLVESKSEDVIAAGFFHKAIKECVLQHLDAILPDLVEDKFLEKFQHSKMELMKSVLKFLAEKDDFHCYKGYLLAPEMFVQQWLFYHANESLFMKNNGERLYDELCRSRVDSIINDITKSVAFATDQCDGRKGINLISPWIDCFVANTQSIPISKERLEHVMKRNVTSVRNFQRTVLLRIEETKKTF